MINPEMIRSILSVRLYGLHLSLTIQNQAHQYFQVLFPQSAFHPTTKSFGDTAPVPIIGR